MVALPAPRVVALIVFGYSLGRISDAQARPSHVQVAKTRLDAFETAVHAYFIEHGEPPPEAGWLNALDILERAPAADPWGYSYLYCRTSGEDGYAIASVGADGVLGTSDDQARGDVPIPARCGPVVKLVTRSWWEEAVSWLESLFEAL